MITSEQLKLARQVLTDHKYNNGKIAMTNEPVGIVIEIKERHGHTFATRKSRVVQWAKEIDVGTLLYTHPVKELTDEEMYKLLEKYQGIELCKAILKKASEK